MWRTIDILPSSLSGDPQVQAACEALDRQLIELYREIPSVAFWTDIESQVPPLLDIMMWEYHVDINEMMLGGGQLTDAKKRALIDESIIWHQKKGTKWIIEHALSFVFEGVSVREWFEYGGRPFFFKVVASSSLNDPDTYRRVLSTIYALKNVRSWLEEFLIAKPSLLQLWETSVTVRNITNRVYMMLRPVESKEKVFVGVALCRHKIRWINAPIS